MSLEGQLWGPFGGLRLRRALATTAAGSSGTYSSAASQARRQNRTDVASTTSMEQMLWEEYDDRAMVRHGRPESLNGFDPRRA